MGDAPADGASVADLRVADVTDRLGEERHISDDAPVALDGAVAGHRADGVAAVALVDVAKRTYSIQVYQPRRTRQPHIQQRDQALPARQDLGVAVRVAQRVQGLVEGSRGDVGERGWLHR